MMRLAVERVGGHLVLPRVVDNRASRQVAAGDLLLALSLGFPGIGGAERILG